MIFNSYEFIFIFFPLSLLGFYFISRFGTNYKIIYLSIVSLLFYTYWNAYSLLIISFSICINYFLGSQLLKQEIKNYNLLLFSIIFNIIFLGYFKYLNFFIFNINFFLTLLNLTTISNFNIMLPLGVSFFTFTQITYLIECYNKNIKVKNFFSYILFVTFFPHLIAGPILKYTSIINQFIDKKIFIIDKTKIAVGITIFIIGLGKKILIADSIGYYADLIYNSSSNNVLEPQIILSWLGSISYLFQLYFDFSGYSDMAIGIALFFGILLPINFNSPLRATSIIDFWNSWHISLTQFIREYIYNPITIRLTRFSLEKSETQKIFLILIFPTLLTFTIIGFWHGANWTFVIFGLMNGLFIVVNYLWNKIKLNNNRSSSLNTYIAWLITFLSINISFVLFRADNLLQALKIYKAMIGLNGMSYPSIETKFWEGSIIFNSGEFANMLGLITISFFIVIFLPNTKSLIPFYKEKNFDNYKLFNSYWFPVILSFIFAISLLQIKKTSPFLYFQF
jgi:alginate O-acetyltransferase complex protein AlgI